MAKRLTVLAGVALLAALIALPSPPRAEGCAAAWSSGGGTVVTPVQIVTETALIVWDEKAKTQHFIRRASFNTKVPYFGFLVPTPTLPELAEAPDELFTRLEDWTKPEVQQKVRYRDVSLFPLGCLAPMASRTTTGMNAPADAVQVFDSVHVAGFKATPFKATDAEELRQWLLKYGYDARPALTAWLDVYVKLGWFITAFQIEKDQPRRDSLSPQAVRMSFKAERPFFPYREPADQAAEEGKRGRSLLRVFFLASGRTRGELDGGAAWPANGGQPGWAGPLDDDRRGAIEKRLDGSGVKLPATTWLTVFDDHAAARAGKPDVFYSPSAEQAEVRRPPIINYKVVPRTPPMEIVNLVVGLFAFVVAPILLLWWWRRLTRRASPA
jgi:hypothetical protein